MPRFTLSIDMDNAAFTDDPRGALADIVHDVAQDDLQWGDIGTIRDVNGNTVGHWEVTE